MHFTTLDPYTHIFAYWHPYPTSMAMKTTIELPEALFAKAKRYARAHKTTLKALIEQGLRLKLAEKGAAEPFKLHDASVNGKGMNPEFRDASWEQLRDTLYQERGA